MSTQYSACSCSDQTGDSPRAAMAGNNVFIGYWKHVTINTTLVVGKKNLNWPSGCPAMLSDNATIFPEGKMLTELATPNR